jgi:hypothetical protein
LGAGSSIGKIVAFSVGAVTSSADATVNGYITANGGAVILGPRAIANGQIEASAAITLGAGTASCDICASGAIIAVANTVFDGATVDESTFDDCIKNTEDCKKCARAFRVPSSKLLYR